MSLNWAGRVFLVSLSSFFVLGFLGWLLLVEALARLDLQAANSLIT